MFPMLTLTLLKLLHDWKVSIVIALIKIKTLKHLKDTKILIIYRMHHFERIKILQCYELTRRCSHLNFYAGFTIELHYVPLVWVLWMFNDVETVKGISLSSI